MGFIGKYGPKGMIVKAFWSKKGIDFGNLGK